MNRPRTQFNPQEGLVIGPTVKERLIEAIGRGDFDNMTSCVVGASGNGKYLVYAYGPLWDSNALANLISAKIANEMLEE